MKARRLSVVVLVVGLMLALNLGASWASCPLLTTATGLRLQPQTAPSDGPTPHGGDITADETWSRLDNPHYLVDTVTVKPGVTLTLEPGVEVYSQGLFRLKVEGHLEAVGTPADPILLRSQTGVPGDWEGIEFWGGLNGDEGGTGELSFVTVRYGGGYGLEGNIRVENVTGGSVVLGYTNLKDSARHGLSAFNGHVSIGYSHLDENGTGIQYHGLMAQAESNITVVGGSTFNSNYGSGIWTDTGSQLSMLGGNEFTGNGSYPLVTEAHNLHQVTNNNNVYYDNAVQRMLILSPTGDRMIGDTTFTPQNGLDGYELDGPLVVDAGVTLRMEPGTWVQGRAFSRLKVIGRLEAEGSDEAPLMFTSAANSGPGEWEGIEFWGGEGEGTGIIRNALVRYGGGGGLTSNIYLGSVTAGEVRIVESQVRDGSRAGISAGNSHVVISDTLIANNGITTADPGLNIGGGSHFTVTISTIEGNNGVGVQLFGDATQLRLTGSRVLGNQADGISVPWGGASLYIEDSLLQDNAGDGIAHSGTATPAMRFSQVYDNDGLGVNNLNTAVCFDAMANYWGDTNGPDDPSAADDGCMGPVANASSGEGVSDDVNYAWWIGSMPSATVVGAALGGSVVFTDSQQMSTTVQVPAGAISETTIVVYTPVEVPTHPVSPDLRFVGHAFDLATYAGGTATPVPQSPVRVSICYTDADVADVEEGSLRLYVWDGAAWQDVVTTCLPPATYERDLEANRLRVPTCHLSHFALLGEAKMHVVYLPLVVKHLE